MTEPDCFIDLMRHGEPVGGRKYRGGLDDPLTPKGWEQMQRTIDDTEGQWDLIVSSPLKRCFDFAAHLGKIKHIPVLSIADFREIGMGNWEGKTPDEITKNTPKLFQSFFIDPVNNRPEGGEPLHDFSHRVIKAWCELLNGHTGKNILIIAHAGVLRAIVCHVLQAPITAMYAMRFKNATRLRINLATGMPTMLAL